MMNEHTPDFIKLMKHPVKFRMFLFFKLPSAYFAGVRVRTSFNCPAIDERLRV